MIYFFVTTCLSIFNVWPKTTLLPVWPRGAKKLVTPGYTYVLVAECPFVDHRFICQALVYFLNVNVKQSFNTCMGQNGTFSRPLCCNKHNCPCCRSQQVLYLWETRLQGPLEAPLHPCFSGQFWRPKVFFILVLPGLDSGDLMSPTLTFL